MKRVIAFFLCLVLLSGAVFTVSAAETQDITASTTFSGSGYSSFAFLSDKNIDSYQVSSGNTTITLSNDQGIGSLYLLFDLEYGAYTITNEATGETFTAGKHEMLHEYVDLIAAFGGTIKSVTLDFASGSVSLSEIYVFSGTDVPDFVQKWDAPLESGADIVLFSTHGDDEQLFFAGVLPYYAGELDYQVEVVYFTNHRNRGTRRCHEMLNGLWSVGVKTYPVFGKFGDYRAMGRQNAYSLYDLMGEDQEEMLGYVVENIRRFKPKVAVGHDIINGEYNHGVHILYAELLSKALELSSNPNEFPESAEKYGTWNVPKTYLHLYPENEIYMDWDQPLSKFNGMTAYEVTKNLGFPCHESQVNDFLWYMSGADTATQVQKYNPCEYGLYRSTVGLDVEKTDFFENVTTHAQDKILEEEARLQAEEEARRAEEEARLAEEAKQKAEAEDKARKEAAEAFAQEQAAQLKNRKMTLFGSLGGILLVLTVALLVLLRKKLNLR